MDSSRTVPTPRQTFKVGEADDVVDLAPSVGVAALARTLSFTRRRIPTTK